MQNNRHESDGCFYPVFYPVACVSANRLFLRNADGQLAPNQGLTAEHKILRIYAEEIPYGSQAYTKPRE